jgi:tetratricopeptide (TPR) repeat protein
MLFRSRFIMAAIGTTLIFAAPSLLSAHGFGGMHFGGGHFGGGHFGGGHFGGGHWGGGHFGGTHMSGNNFGGGAYRGNVGTPVRTGNLAGARMPAGGVNRGAVGPSRAAAPSFLSQHSRIAGHLAGRGTGIGNLAQSHVSGQLNQAGIGQKMGAGNSFSSRHSIQLASHTTRALHTANSGLANSSRHIGAANGSLQNMRNPFYGQGFGLQFLSNLLYSFGGYGSSGYGGYGSGGYGGGGYGYGGSPYYGSGYGSGYLNSSCSGYGCAYAYNPAVDMSGQYLAYNNILATPVGFDPASAAMTPGTSNGVTLAAITDPAAMLPANPAAPTATVGFADQGEAAFKAGDFNGAIYAWRHAVLDDSKNPVLLMMLSQSLFAAGKFDEAAGATQQAMQQLPKDQWGVVVTNYKELYGSIQSYTDQLRALEKAVADKPNSAGLRFLLGFHYGYLGFPQQAVPQLDKALEFAKEDALSRQLRTEMQTRIK